MDDDKKMPEQKFSVVEFQNVPTEYHTWGCLVFVLEDPLQGGTEGLPEWETRAITGIYLENYPFHSG